MKRLVALASVVLLSTGPLAADVVVLRGGGAIKGEVVEERADAVVVETAPGRVTVPAARVLHIVRGTTDLSGYRARAAALATRDVQGWLALAAWAADHGLLTQSREAYEHVLVLDPGNAEAHAAHGDVRLGDRWMSAADSYRARGLVELDGQWVTPAERAAFLSERAAEARSRQAVREAEARAREAEARARAAEAEARRADAEARQAAEPANGVPYPWVYGPGATVVPPVLVPGHTGRRHHDDRRPVPPTPLPSPPVKPITGSMH